MKNDAQVASRMGPCGDLALDYYWALAFRFSVPVVVWTWLLTCGPSSLATTFHLRLRPHIIWLMVRCATFRRKFQTMPDVEVLVNTVSGSMFELGRYC